MAKLLQRLIVCPSVSVTEASKVGSGPEKGLGGVYVFYERGKPIYVGRSSNIKHRFSVHRTSDVNGASFAFKLTELSAKKQGINLSGHKNRKQKLENAKFKRLFIENKRRIGNMQVRWVQVEDSITQAIFEMYVHMELKTKYNDFDNH